MGIEADRGGGTIRRREAKEAPMIDVERAQMARLVRVGYAADPAIDTLLDKSRIAQIRVRQLEMAVKELESQIELANMQISLLKEEYKIR